ncbi:class I SAM-dependent methyltransferase [Nocardiopsis sp. NPDC057823]|uniref:class I SAM-dependent methyltransferase n=1 Tax=Nocardiopsis sp. NPDC057823 TaxID=3346256 RepID=UPI00366B52EE
MTTTTWDSVYDRCAAGYDPHVGHFAVLGYRLVDLVDPLPGERVLDVAAGRGACLFPAAERVGPAGAVHGVDLSEGMVAQLAADIAGRGTANATAARMDAQALTVAEGSYDRVLCAFALFLMPDPGSAARGFLRALRPGGRCGVSVPVEQLMPGDRAAMSDLFRSVALRAGPAAARRPDFDMNAGGLLAEAGFTGVRVVEEESAFVFADTAAWWEWTWTTGFRAFYERLPADLLEEFRERAFALLEPAVTREGLRATARTRFAVGTRPGGPGM